MKVHLVQHKYIMDKPNEWRLQCVDINYVSDKKLPFVQIGLQYFYNIMHSVWEYLTPIACGYNNSYCVNLILVEGIFLLSGIEISTRQACFSLS